MGPLSSGGQSKDLPEQGFLGSPASKNYDKNYLDEWPQEPFKYAVLGTGRRELLADEAQLQPLEEVLPLCQLGPLEGCHS